MRIEFEITDEEIIRSNKIGYEYLDEDNIFPPDLYYEGIVIIDDGNNTIREQYSLIDFTSRLFNFFENLKDGEDTFLEIEFTEDYMPIILKKQNGNLILQLKYEPNKLNLKFEEFKKKFIIATKNLYSKLMSFEESEILRKTTDEYLAQLFSRLKI